MSKQQTPPSIPQPPSIPPYQGGSMSSLPDKGGRGVGFLPYDKNLTAFARENRSNPTPAERTIWREVLRKRQLSRFKFLRQKPIGQYIVDFYCSELRLVIEIDGDSHAQAIQYDAKRTTFINSLGLRVIRYTNDEVLNNLEGIYDDLMRQLLLEEADQ